MLNELGRQIIEITEHNLVTYRKLKYIIDSPEFFFIVDKCDDKELKKLRKLFIEKDVTGVRDFIKEKNSKGQFDSYSVNKLRKTCSSFNSRFPNLKIEDYHRLTKRQLIDSLENGCQKVKERYGEL